MRDWLAWHDAYDDPASPLARRLAIVQLRVAEALEASGGDIRRALVLCAGDGRDVLPVLAATPEGRRPPALLIEQDERLGMAAQRRAAEHGVTTANVLVGDAGDPRTFVDQLPVDLLLLCGIFGNVSTEDVRTMIAALPAVLSPGGFVIWTRGPSDPDLRPMIRAWFDEPPLGEVSFDGGDAPYGVGVARLTGPVVEAVALPDRLFSFVR